MSVTPKNPKQSSISKRKSKINSKTMDKISTKYTSSKPFKHYNALKTISEWLTLKRSKTKSSTFQNLSVQNVSNSQVNCSIVKKTVIFDMDETLIHCVDDVETDDPDVILEIDFPDEETVYVSII